MTREKGLGNKGRIHWPLLYLGYIDCFRPRIFILENQTSAAFILRVHRPLLSQTIQNKSVRHRSLWSLLVLKINHLLLTDELLIRSPTKNPLTFWRTCQMVIFALPNRAMVSTHYKNLPPKKSSF